MLFSPYLPVSSLVVLCRTLKHYLGAGLNIVEVFRYQSKRKPADLRPVARRVTEELAAGNSLMSALRKERGFPPLFLALAEVGEESGHLTEIFATMERYYALQQHLERRFRAKMIAPVLQFFLAVLIIAFVIWVLGWLKQSRGGFGPGGVMGLSGASGALTFLGIAFGSVTAAFVGIQLLRHKLHRKQMVDAILLRIPILGAATRALALARFTIAMHMTMESGMLITRAIRLSLQATGNAAFEALADPVVAQLKKGNDLASAIRGRSVFPREFRQALDVAEQGGRLPEAMEQQSHHWQEEAERRLKALTRAATGAVWLIYATFMVIMIFQLAQIYLSALPK